MSTVGNKVKIKYFGSEYEGIILESSDKNMHLLKLINGYNVGLPKKGSKVEVLGKSRIGLKSDFAPLSKNKLLRLSLTNFITRSALSILLKLQVPEGCNRSGCKANE